MIGKVCLYKLGGYHSYILVRVYDKKIIQYEEQYRFRYLCGLNNIPPCAIILSTTEDRLYPVENKFTIYLGKIIDWYKYLFNVNYCRNKYWEKEGNVSFFKALLELIVL